MVTRSQILSMRPRLTSAHPSVAPALVYAPLAFDILLEKYMADGYGSALFKYCCSLPVLEVGYHNINFCQGEVTADLDDDIEDDMKLDVEPHEGEQQEVPEACSPDLQELSVAQALTFMATEKTISSAALIAFIAKKLQEPSDEIEDALIERFGDPAEDDYELPPFLIFDRALINWVSDLVDAG